MRALNDLATVAHRKMRLSWRETHALLSTICALLPMQPITVETHETGLALAARYGLSIYDAMNRPGLHAECDTLWSEDTHDGMVVQERLRIANPFRID